MWKVNVYFVYTDFPSAPEALTKCNFPIRETYSTIFLNILLTKFKCKVYVLFQDTLNVRIQAIEDLKSNYMSYCQSALGNQI